MTNDFRKKGSALAIKPAWLIITLIIGLMIGLAVWAIFNKEQSGFIGWLGRLLSPF